MALRLQIPWLLIRMMSASGGADEGRTDILSELLDGRPVAQVEMIHEPSASQPARSAASLVKRT